jgi:hypothetical protein
MWWGDCRRVSRAQWTRMSSSVVAARERVIQTHFPLVEAQCTILGVRESDVRAIMTRLRAGVTLCRAQTLDELQTQLQRSFVTIQLRWVSSDTLCVDEAADAADTDDLTLLVGRRCDVADDPDYPGDPGDPGDDDDMYNEAELRGALRWLRLDDAHVLGAARSAPRLFTDTGVEVV